MTESKSNYINISSKIKNSDHSSKANFFQTRKRILITGGCGFLGSAFCEHIYKTTNWKIFIIDKLSYASAGISRLEQSGILADDRISLLTFDLINPISKGMMKILGDIHYIVHMAAESHVDNSIKNPAPFIHNNVMSTMNILEYAKTLPNLIKMNYFGTDEEFGPALNGILFKETDKLNPKNPYAASKAACSMLCKAHANTYRLPIFITRCMNIFGEMQMVEKFIPKTMKYVLDQKTLPIHCYPGKEKSGSRFYIHTRNVSAAVLFLLEHAKNGESYNIKGDKEVGNLELAQFIAKEMKMNLKYEMMDFHSDRPGHDLRYGLDGTKLSKMGFKPPVDFENSLRKTIQWNLKHQHWLDEKFYINTDFTCH